MTRWDNHRCEGLLTEAKEALAYVLGNLPWDSEEEIDVRMALSHVNRTERALKSAKRLLLAEARNRR